MSEVREAARRHLWHPLSRMAEVLGHEKVIVRGEGSCVYDESGRKYIDGSAGLWYLNVGHGRREIIDAVNRQMRELTAFPIFGDYVNVPAAQLAERLSTLTPGDLNRCFFAASGSDAIETAIKIARNYYRLLGQSQRYKVIARRRAYHGTTLGASSAVGITAYRRQSEPTAPGFLHVPHSSISALDDLIQFEGPETIAAIIAEPIIGSGGVLLPPQDYFSSVRAICDRYEILFIADEVICGFGRCGHWFGIQHWNVTPDLIAMAKGITSGYIPLGAVVISDRVCEPFLAESADGPLMHGSTYAGHPVACAAALANLDILEDEGLCERASSEGRYFYELLSGLVDETNLVTEVRGGIGLMIGVQLNAPPETQIAKAVVRRAFDQGVLVRPLMGNIVALSPPLTIARRELGEICRVLRSSIEEEESTMVDTLGARGPREDVSPEPAR